LFKDTFKDNGKLSNSGKRIAFNFNTYGTAIGLAGRPLADQPADLYAKSRSWDSAEEHFGKAIRLKSNAYWILQGYAHAKLGAGQAEEAELLLQQSLEKIRGNSPTLADLRVAHARLGDEVAAESYFEQAIDVDPNNAFAYTAYARFLLRTQRYAEGLEMKNSEYD